MKKKKRTSRSVRLADMRDRLQAIQQYDDPDEKFDWLLYAFMKYTHRATSWKNQVKKQGHMSQRFAKQFADYCGYPIHKPLKI